MPDFADRLHRSPSRQVARSLPRTWLAQTGLLNCAAGVAADAASSPLATLRALRQPHEVQERNPRRSAHPLRVPAGGATAVVVTQPWQPPARARVVGSLSSARRVVAGGDAALGGADDPDAAAAAVRRGALHAQLVQPRHPAELARADGAEAGARAAAGQRRAADPGLLPRGPRRAREAVAEARA